MKKIIIFLIITVFALSSCKSYLDEVPDNSDTLESLYATRANAWNGLSKVYSYLPNIYDSDISPWLLGDEYIGRKSYDTELSNYLGIRIMRGFQNESNPLLGYWSGTYGGSDLYEAIRQCNIFIDNIHIPTDMTDEEKRDWSAQAKFLKAYYHFLLMQEYGPIVIRDKSISLDAPKEELYLNRMKIDSCFNFIIRTMNEAIPYLKEYAVTEDAGQIDQIGAKAIKARVLLFRASPFYNGNVDYYSHFLDYDGQPFFPQNYDINKWQDAIKACDDAFAICEKYSKGLFHFEGEPYLFDRDAFDINGERMKTLYDLRLLITTPWNKELLWGFSNQYLNNGDFIGGGRNVIFGRTQIRFWAVMQSVMGAFTGYSGDNDDCENYANQNMSATYAMVERYYTENGLPIEDDMNFQTASKYFQYDVPAASDDAYAHWAGYMQPDMETVYLYMNREPRFYANLGITGGYWRGHYFLIPFNPYYSTSGTSTIPRGDSGKTPIYPFGGRESWRKRDDFLETCIGIQKFVHPESYSGNWTRIQRSPFPIIRYADLLLMKAEALNEFSGPSQEVYNLLNQVRKRAGIPAVEESWKTGGLAKNPGKHLTQDGLRDIILHERGIEMAFEGSRFYDMLRYKRAPKEFSKPVYGWNNMATDIGGQTGNGPELKQVRSFTITNCLWPIDLGELNKQGTLIQNPGWR